MSTQLQTTSVANFLKGKSTRDYLESILNERTGQFITSLVSMANLNPALAKCDPKTLLGCGLKAASMNLPLDNNLGFAYAIAYGTSAQFQMGYRGFVQLAQRSGQYRSINVMDIRQGELVKWDPFTEEIELVLIEDATKREAQVVIGYAATFELQNGFRKVSYWSRDKVEKHGKRFSKSFNAGPWKSDFDAMGKKVVLKDLISKWGPMTTELQEAIKYDQAVIRGADAPPDYVDTELSDDEAPKISDIEQEFKEKHGAK